jgi:hypothetical protein
MTPARRTGMLVMVRGTPLVVDDDGAVDLHSRDGLQEARIEGMGY